MTLSSMRKLGVHRLLVSRLRCQHEALIDVPSYWADTTVPSFIPRMKCTQCGDRRVDLRPNWNEASPVTDWRGRPAMPTGDE